MPSFKKYKRYSSESASIETAERGSTATCLNAKYLIGDRIALGTLVSTFFCQVTKFCIPSKEKMGTTHKEQRQCTYVKD